jgi:hypothetical protein
MIVDVPTVTPCCRVRNCAVQLLKVSGDTTIARREMVVVIAERSRAGAGARTQLNWRCVFWIRVLASQMLEQA